MSAADKEFEMEMGAGGHACRTHSSDDVSLSNPLPVANMDAVEVGVLCDVWTGVIDADEVAVAAFATGVFDHS